MAQFRHELTEVLDDLKFKHISFIPRSELSSAEQLCYAFKEAYYEYADEYRAQDPTLPHLSFAEFVSNIVERVGGLEFLRPQVPEILARFNRRNAGVPVYGAALLNVALDHVLLVQSVSKNNKGVWMFPRGKLEYQDNENRFKCAWREVWEETGYDIAPLAVQDDEHYIEANVNVNMINRPGEPEVKKKIGIFIVPGVDDQFGFEPQVKGEVAGFAWFKLSELANHCNNGTDIFYNNGATKAKFLNVKPFVRRLCTFANGRKKNKGGRKNKADNARQLVPHQAATAAYDQSPLWADPTEVNNSPGVDFDTIVALNKGLAGKDLTRPYDGVRPAYQLPKQTAASLEDAQQLLRDTQSPLSRSSVPPPQVPAPQVTRSQVFPPVYQAPAITDEVALDSGLLAGVLTKPLPPESPLVNTGSGLGNFQFDRERIWSRLIAS